MSSFPDPGSLPHLFGVSDAVAHARISSASSWVRSVSKGNGVPKPPRGCRPPRGGDGRGTIFQIRALSHLEKIPPSRP